MRSSVERFGWTVLSLCAVVSAHVSAQSQEQSSTIAPNVELWPQSPITVAYEGNFYRDAEFDTWNKRVSFDWRATTGELPSTTNLRATTSESFATPYWPNVVLPTDRFQLCVAGRNASGATILERWLFANRTSDGKAAPGIATAPGAYVWTLPPRIRVDAILQLPPTSPHGMIRGLIPSLKSADQVFVYFNTSRELALVDLTTRVMRTIAAPSGGSGSLVVPELKNDYWSFWAADYRKHGYCYFFENREYVICPPTPREPYVAFIDSDRDGAIDKSELISVSQWNCDGWGDAANTIPTDRGF